MVKKKVASKKKVFVRPDPVFIPVNYEVYRKHKMNLLNTQIKVLECVKTINRIIELQKQKDSLKLELYRRLSEALRLYYQTQELLPTVNNPGLIKKLEKTVEVAVNYTSGDSSLSFSQKVSQTDEVDMELREIQEKLNALNSSREIQ
jgi:hypothetical protein